MEAIEATSTTVEYAPKRPPHRRRVVRRAVWPLALVAVGLAAWRWGPEYARRARFVYRQSQCMNFTAPADHVAYEEEPQHAATLGKRAGYRSAISAAPAATTQAFYPPPLERFRGVQPPSAFMGGRTTPAGEQRLVVVSTVLSLHDFSGERSLTLHGRSFAPGSMGDTRVSRSFATGTLTLNLSRIYRLRLFWGQRDPQHAERFTIGYVVNDQPGTIDGQLMDDGKVYLTVRDGPLTKPVQR